MAKGSVKDTFANVAAVRVVESANNTQTSVKFDFPFSIMDKMALVINRIEYWTALLTHFGGAGDALYLALTAASSIKDIAAQNDPLVIDSHIKSLAYFGTAASAQVVDGPYIKDFSDLPGGGLLVAPNPLYAMAQGISLGGVSDSWIKLFYTYVELSSDEYWQLVESRRVISS